MSKEHFRTLNSLGLLQRHGAITVPMHDADQYFARNFVFGQINPVGAPDLERIAGGFYQILKSMDQLQGFD